MDILWIIILVVFMFLGIQTNTIMLNDWVDKDISMVARCFVVFIGTVGYISLVLWLGIILTYFFGGVTVK